MIQWPSFARGTTGQAPAPVELSLAEAGWPAAPPVEWPPVAEPSEPIEIPSVGSLADPSALLSPAPRRRNLAALGLSVLIHTAAVAAVALLIVREGIDAPTDAISVEIVVDPAPDAADHPAIAGTATETIEADSPAAEAVESPPDPVAPPPALSPEPSPVAEAAPPDPVETAQPEAARAEPDPVPSQDLLPAEPALPQPAIATEPSERVEAAPPEPASALTGAVTTFEPLQPLTAFPQVMAETPAEANPQTAEGPMATAEQELAVPPSLEAMLPALDMPAPPRFPSPSPETVILAEPEAPIQVKPEPRPVRPAAAPREPAPAKPRAAAAEPRETPRKTVSATPAAARETPRKTRTAARDGGAREKVKAKSATQAGSTASAAASAGDRETYGRKVNGHVQRYKRYPDAAARGGMRGAVKVSISIGGTGNLAAARVTASSGFPVLDSEALATVRRAAPYPKPPASFGGAARFSLTLRYSK